MMIGRAAHRAPQKLAKCAGGVETQLFEAARRADTSRPIRIGEFTPANRPWSPPALREQGDTASTPYAETRIAGGVD